ncbi:MAG: hypothetical protein Q7K40_03230 [bacterium]|nr:hypothetical protein [bacterium]
MNFYLRAFYELLNLLYVITFGCGGGVRLSVNFNDLPSLFFSKFSTKHFL